MTTRAELSEIAADKDGNTELMRAALVGDTKKVKELLASGADVNARNSDGRTALMFALINLHSDTAKALIEHGAELNTTDNEGGTALLIAVGGGDTECVRALLSKGGDPSARYSLSGETGLAIARQRGYDDIVMLLEETEVKE